MLQCPRCARLPEDGRVVKVDDLCLQPLGETGLTCQGRLTFVRPLATDHGLTVTAPTVTSATGAGREDKVEKGRFDLVPYEPQRRLAVHYERGGKRYGDRNWEKGLPLHDYLSCASRHLAEFIGGDRREDHLIACVWNIFSYIATEKWIDQKKLPEELRTIPHSLPEKS